LTSLSVLSPALALSLSRFLTPQICQHIMNKLMACRADASEELIKSRTGQFEAHMYEMATSRSDYLQRIASGLTKFQNRGSELVCAMATTPSDIWRNEMKRKDRVKVCAMLPLRLDLAHRDLARRAAAGPPDSRVPR
jgi:hypothetical protein